jgi:hypothetical protein
MALSIEEIAREAAVTKLGLDKAVREYFDTLDARLEEADERAQNTPVNSDMMFAALSLPIANGLIHFASTREKLISAEVWIREQLEDTRQEDVDPLATLSALTLIYLVHEGYVRNRADPKKAETWNRMIGRVKNLQKI